MLRESFPESFRIAVVADLDKKSKKTDAKGKDSWTSMYMTGTLHRQGSTYSISWDAPAELTTAVSGR